MNRSYRDGNSETVEAANPTEELYVMLKGYEAFSGVELKTATRGTPALVLGATSLSFSFLEGSSTAAAVQLVAVVDSTGAPITWTPTVDAASAGWLAAAASGAELQVAVKPGGLVAGVYRGKVTVTTAAWSTRRRRSM